jgi:hypothetical protein
VRAQAKPITNMPDVTAKTRSIVLGRLPSLIKSKCLQCFHPDKYEGAW